MKKKYAVIGILALMLIFTPTVLTINDNINANSNISRPFNDSNLNNYYGPTADPHDPGDVDFPIILDGEDTPPP